jgi:hypothetical protein
VQKARPRAGFLFCLLAAAACLGGCISLPQTEALRASPPGGLPPRVELAQVPFHLQDDFLCGPATLAMVFNAAGVNASVESVTPMVYLPGRKGSLQAEMLGATRRSGLVAYTPSPRLEAVLRELAAGTPVIVLLNLSGTRLLPVWHYAVLIGYDLEAGHVIARSGKRSRDEWKFGFLEFFWQDSNHWSMLALPPGRLPATAGDQDFALAVAALEQAGGRAQARTSYRALLQRWPDNLVGLIGLANVEYALKDLPAAERALRHAAKAHPQSAVAYNNLAHVLLELGQLRDAEAAARHAVSLAGPTLAEARKTLEAIEARRGSGR